MRSTSAAALEYFRWDTPVRRLDEHHHVIEAPDVVTNELVIRVAPGADQKVRTRPGYFLYAERWPSEVIRVRPSWRPLAIWLPTYLAQID